MASPAVAGIVASLANVLSLLLINRFLTSTDFEYLAGNAETRAFYGVYISPMLQLIGIILWVAAIMSTRE